MLEINPIKKVTVTEQVMEQMASWITSNQLKPGEKLPNERLLAEQFGVNRGRIRESLRALALIGLITIKPGEGSFVSKHESPIPAETILWMYYNEINNLDEIYAARKLIESAVYLEASKQMTESDIHQLEKIMEDLEKVPKNESNPEMYQQLLDKFDIHMGHFSKNKIYSKLMQTIVHLRHESMVKILNIPGALENSIGSRTKLMKAIKSYNQDEIQQAIDQNFSGAKKLYSKIK